MLCKVCKEVGKAAMPALVHLLHVYVMARRQGD